MSNMSYCRFHNTSHDLRECEDALESGEQLSNEEIEKAVDLVRCCRRIAKMFEDIRDKPPADRAAIEDSIRANMTDPEKFS